MYITSDMYATSKLIIPPKPARDSPFIPKLRIRLRHSPNNLCDNREQSFNTTFSGSPHSAGGCDDDGTHANMDSLVGVCSFSMLGSTSANASHQNSFNNLSKASRQCRRKLSECTMKRAATKRKQSSSLLDTLDLENPDSILTKVNLKLLINRETFFSFP
ncbi:unnamed protein product [Heterobilharzia americana]|nr:unnamed protein product [Heterobilharzia americana]